MAPKKPKLPPGWEILQRDTPEVGDHAAFLWIENGIEEFGVVKIIKYDINNPAKTTIEYTEKGKVLNQVVNLSPDR